MRENMKSLSLIINITYCMSSLIITIINYLLKKEEDQETVGIIMSSLIIVIINYCKKLEKTNTVGEKKKGLHVIYL